MASPLAHGLFLAAAALPPLTNTTTMVLEKFEEGKYSTRHGIQSKKN
jgi:hypothetical protein